MFGVVRQVANDFSSVVHNSMISAQYPDREAFVTKLAQSKTLPSMEELERFWFELQREMTETGKVVKFKTKVVTPEGDADASVGDPRRSVQRDERRSLPRLHARASSSSRSWRVSRARSSQGPAHALEEHERRLRRIGRRSDARRAAVDLRAAPELVGAHREGRSSSATSSLLVGVVGAVLAAVSAVLSRDGARHACSNQLKFPNDPVPDNPLGRVLATFKGDAEKLEAGRRNRRAAHLRGGAQGSAEARALPVLPAPRSRGRSAARPDRHGASA